MRLNSPYSTEHYIELPGEWLGIHAQRHDEAWEASSEMPSTWRNFATAMSLLDDWSLPGVPKNSSLWNFAELGLPLMVWVTTAVFKSYNECYEIPKNSLPPSSVHLATAAKKAGGAGTIEP